MKLLIAYCVSAGAMFIGLLLMRADSRAYFRWPVYSAMVMALGVVLWNLLRKHLFPVAWAAEHAGMLYAGALGVYAVLGFALGALLGRLARKPTDRGSQS
jgi:hypothetical protein